MCFPWTLLKWQGSVIGRTGGQLQNGSCRGRAGAQAAAPMIVAPLQTPSPEPGVPIGISRNLIPPNFQRNARTLEETEQGRQLGPSDNLQRRQLAEPIVHFPHSRRFRHSEQRGANNRIATPHRTRPFAPTSLARLLPVQHL